MEHPELSWIGRLNYLSAKSDNKRVEMYVADLLWVLARGNVIKEGSPMPSEILTKKNAVDRRTGKQIVDDILKGLGGE